MIALITVVSASMTGCGSDDSKNADSSESTASVVSAAETNETSDSEQAEQNTDNEEQPVQQKAENEEEKPIPEISDPTPDSEGEWSNNIFIYNGVAYEAFYGGDENAKEYADTISYIKKQLGTEVTLYNVIAPTHVGIDLPEKFKDEFTPQEDYIKKIISSYSADVKGVSAYSELVHHRDEYLYFGTDHHWTGRGAYYAYRAFADAAGITPVELDTLKSDKIEDFSGTLQAYSERDDLKEDYVEYFYPDYDIDCQCYDENGENPFDYQLLHTYTEGSNAYGVFLGGDQPLIVAKNKNGNGKKVAVIKESFGNAFAPFLAYTYNETHIIDFRSAKFNLNEYFEKNGITDVIIINNAMATATPERLEELMTLIGG